MKRVAILQSNYIPWKGYFDIINSVDEFILYDDMQYTRRDWRNRNKIKTPQGSIWLTIPVEVKGKYYQKINETIVSEKDWNVKHWKTISSIYAKAPFIADYKPFFEKIFIGCTDESLSKINYRFITGISSLLGIKTKISWSMDYKVADGKTERLVNLCRQANATEYISGPSAKGYIVDEMFDAAEIKLSYMNYDSYPEYNQMFPPFDHFVSIVDLIFNMGPESSKYMKSFKECP